METLKEEIGSVVMEKHQFENRDYSLSMDFFGIHALAKIQR